MIDRLLQIHLEPIVRDHRRWQTWRDWIRCWLAAAGIGIGLALIRHFTGWASAWSAPLLLGAALIATWIIGRWRSRGGPDYRALARRIEESDPKLHALLLTAVEQKPDPRTGHLSYLQERVIREALARDASCQWRGHSLTRLFFVKAGGFVTLLLLAGIVVTLLPFRNHARPLIERHLAQGEVDVTPGDASIEKGSSLTVLARFGKPIPRDAILVVRPANEPERRLPLVKNLDDPVFGTSVTGVESELTYRVEFGERSTRDFRVTVFEYPRLERADATVAYPEYTGIPGKTINDTRRVSAVEGSRLDFEFHLNKPVRSAALVARGEAPVALVPDPERPNVYATGFLLDRNLRYELALTDEEGRTNRLAPRFVIDVLKNRPPELKIAFPRGDQRVSALEEIAFEAEASDDFGLRAFGIAYNLAGQSPRIIELGTDSKANEKRRFDYLLAVEELGAEPDQLLTYYLWADDMGPDGKLRRMASDMYFAEIRPFDEIFREGQDDAGEGSAQQQQQGQGQGQGPGEQAERLAELQKQIISATWNIQRRETGTPSPQFGDDVATVKESQENALEQVRTGLTEAADSQARELLEQAAAEMEKAASRLEKAASGNSIEPLQEALLAEQLAYQALLRMAEREFQVARSRNQQGQQGQQGQRSRGERAQRQLSQLDLRQNENRYETPRLASPEQTAEQREQVQAFSRLRELARRQQDVNERLRELQAALQEARTEAEREEIRRTLQRLREEQQELVANVDELRQRMDRPENQSRMAEAREQLDQTRDEVQRAAEAMERGAMQEAIASGTRAQRELQELREEFRRRSSSQFADEMRELRNRAQELSQRQEEIGGEIEALNRPEQRRLLTDSEERNQLARQLVEQRDRLNQLIEQAGEITREAEPVEPLLARQLYDTLRRAAQDDTRNLRETEEDLLSERRLYQEVQNLLSRGARESRRAVDVTADLLRGGFSTEAGDLEERARRSIHELRRSVERAAESVLGDETEALRLARRELEELSDQLEREIAQGERRREGEQAAAGERGQGRGGDMEEGAEGEPREMRLAQAGQGEDQEQQGRGEGQGRGAQGESEQQGEGQAQGAGRGQGQGQEPGEGEGQGQGRGQGQETAQGQGQGEGEGQAQGRGQGQGEGEGQGQGRGQGQETAQGQGQGEGEGQAQGRGQGQGRGQEGEGRGEGEGQGQGRGVNAEVASNEQQGQRGGEQGGRGGGGGNTRGGGNFLDQFGGPERGGGGERLGPLTGGDYARWAERLRDVEEMLDDPELRREAARIRDRAQLVRADFQRHSNEPQWDLVRMEVAGPMIELRSRIAQELARRDSSDALVPIDRDPVPTRYAELVRRYYEELGKGEPADSNPPQGRPGGGGSR